MRHLRWKRVLVALVVVSTALAGCGDDDDSDESSDEGADVTTDDGGGEPADEVEALDVTAVDYAFTGLPEELAGGNVTLTMTNGGEAAHEITFVNIGDETNAETFFDDFGPVITDGGPWPDYVENIAGANEAMPGEALTVTYQLQAGTYMVFCALTGTPEDPEGEGGKPHFVEGMQQLVTVTEGETGDLPEADGTITAMDYEFAVDLSSGDQVINFANDGPNDHFAGISRFPDGTTVEDAEAAMQAMLGSEDGNPPAGTPEPEDIGFSGIASTGTAMQFELAAPLEAGVYSFVCFISDRAGGPPHAIGHQMFDVVEIS